MQRRFFGHDDPEPQADRARRETGAWLTWALFSGVNLPRIPIRRVGEGGFSPLMRTTAGRAWARSWWSEAIRAVDLDV